MSKESQECEFLVTVLFHSYNQEKEYIGHTVLSSRFRAKPHYSNINIDVDKAIRSLQLLLVQHSQQENPVSRRSYRPVSHSLTLIELS